VLSFELERAIRGRLDLLGCERKREIARYLRRRENKKMSSSTLTIIECLMVAICGLGLLGLSVVTLIGSVKVLSQPTTAFRVCVGLMGLYAALSFFAYGLFLLLIGFLEGAS
jgi:hypothetical protein